MEREKYNLEWNKDKTKIIFYPDKDGKYYLSKYPSSSTGEKLSEVKTISGIPLLRAIKNNIILRLFGSFKRVVNFQGCIFFRFIIRAFHEVKI